MQGVQDGLVIMHCKSVCRVEHWHQYLYCKCSKGVVVSYAGLLRTTLRSGQQDASRFRSTYHTHLSRGDIVSWTYKDIRPNMHNP